MTRVTAHWCTVPQEYRSYCFEDVMAITKQAFAARVRTANRGVGSEMGGSQNDKNNTPKTIGDLCHEAPAHAVTRTSRSSATESIDKFPGGFFLH
jgi:hypothetical protein